MCLLLSNSYLLPDVSDLTSLGKHISTNAVNHRGSKSWFCLISGTEPLSKGHLAISESPPGHDLPILSSLHFPASARMQAQGPLSGTADLPLAPAVPPGWPTGGRHCPSLYHSNSSPEELWPSLHSTARLVSAFSMDLRNWVPKGTIP